MCRLIVLKDFAVSSQQTKVVKFSSLSGNITLFLIFHERKKVSIVPVQDMNMYRESRSIVPSFLNP
jgi:hypothetical protein